MTTAGARRHLDAVEQGWGTFRAAVDRLSPEELRRTTPAGWSAKEMLAHVAFWEETVKPVIVGWFRGEPEESFAGWYGGDELGLTRDDPWPVADVHNAREAAWARSRKPTDVLDRLDRAHRQLVQVVGSLSDEEAETDRYAEKVADATWRHYRQHLAELEAVAASRGG